MSVHARNNFPSCRSDAEVESVRNRTSRIIYHRYGNIWTLRLKLSDQIARAILRNTVDHNNFIAGLIILINQLFESFQNESLLVVTGYYNRNERGVGG